MKLWCDEPGKVVLIGQGPTAETDGHPPFSGRIGRTVATLMGIRQGELCTHFALANLFESWQGTSRFGDGDAFAIDAARKRARKAAVQLRGRQVVLFSASLARAFEVEPRDILMTFRTEPRSKIVVAYVPHPLAVHTWWADRANHARACEFLEGLVDVRWGARSGSINRTPRNLNEIE